MGESIVYALKMALVAISFIAFTVAITALLNALGYLTMSSVFGEVIGIISMCLPFNALSVFSSFGVVCGAILAFLVVRKIYGLQNKNYSAT